MHHQPERAPRPTGASPMRAIAFIVTALVGFSALFCMAAIFWLSTGPEGGVRLTNEMEEYATIYIEEHQILRESEKLLAYYDTTIMLRGTEAYLLTDERVIHHRESHNVSIELADVKEIQVKSEVLLGTIIKIYAADGRLMKLEIAPMNGGDDFVALLNRLVS